MEKNKKTVSISFTLPRALVTPLETMANQDGRHRSGFLSWLIAKAVEERMKKLKN